MEDLKLLSGSIFMLQDHKIDAFQNTVLHPYCLDAYVAQKIIALAYIETATKEHNLTKEHTLHTRGLLDHVLHLFDIFRGLPLVHCRCSPSSSSL